MSAGFGVGGLPLGTDIWAWQSDMGLSYEEVRSAARVVVLAAHDSDEARRMLAQLGLLAPLIEQRGTPPKGTP